MDKTFQTLLDECRSKYGPQQNQQARSSVEVCRKDKLDLPNNAALQMAEQQTRNSQPEGSNHDVQ